MTGEVGLHATPVVARNVVIVGAAHLSGGVPERARRNVKGLRARLRRADRQAAVDLPHHPAARRVRQRHVGEGLVVVHRQRRRVGADQVDEELGIAYLPVELPTGDYYGGHRPGNGLFGESLVAVDLKTGKRKWHYQLVHHGIWDMDIPCAPILLTSPSTAGRSRRVAQPTKQALLYVFDRVTGQADLADRRAAGREGRRAGRVVLADAAVPDASRRRTTARASSIDDLIDFTPELRAEAMKLVSRTTSSGRSSRRRWSARSEGPLGDADLAGDTAAARTGPAARRSRDAHRVRLFASRRRLARAGPAGSGEVRHGVHPGQRAHRRAARREGGLGARQSAGAAAPAAPARGVRRRRRRRRADRAGAAAREAAVRTHHARST